MSENSSVQDQQLAAGFTPLNLTSSEIDDLVLFLENALHDPDLLRYQPASVLSGLCFPNNDDLSRIDLGCN